MSGAGHMGMKPLKRNVLTSNETARPIMTPKEEQKRTDLLPQFDDLPDDHQTIVHEMVLAMYNRELDDEDKIGSLEDLPYESIETLCDDAIAAFYAAKAIMDKQRDELVLAARLAFGNLPINSPSFIALGKALSRVTTRKADCHEEPLQRMVRNLAMLINKIAYRHHKGISIDAALNSAQDYLKTHNLMGNCLREEPEEYHLCAGCDSPSSPDTECKLCGCNTGVARATNHRESGEKK